MLCDKYWMNDDDLDSLGVVDLFCHEEFDDESPDGLAIETDVDISWLDSPWNFPFSSLISPRTFQGIGADLDFELSEIFDDDDNYRRDIGLYEYESEHGLSLAIDSNEHNGFNLGQLVTDSIYNLITFSPFSAQSSSPRSFFGGDYL